MRGRNHSIVPTPVNLPYHFVKVLIENGYAPQWVQLEREIRDEKDDIKKKLEKCRAVLGPLPLTPSEQVNGESYNFLLINNIFIDAS